MRYYFAPLEGITDGIYRKLHHTYFPGITQYYTPFFSPTVHRQLTLKEQRELPLAQNLGFRVIPQLLTKNPEDFLWMAQQCRDLGYPEVNLNLGCPSGTVTAKGKGSGMLRDLDGLDRFLDTVFAGVSLPISVKTRLGFSSPEEFPKILEVLNRYPIAELTVHPRVRDAFYSGDIDMAAFGYAVENSRCAVCYNGNLNTLKDIAALTEKFPKVQSVMLGRGLIADPGMVCPQKTDAATLEAFYNALLEEYLAVFGGSRNAMFRLKEHWRYLAKKFRGSEKLYKQLRKTTDLTEYRQITAAILRTLPLEEGITPDW